MRTTTRPTSATAEPRPAATPVGRALAEEV